MDFSNRAQPQHTGQGARNSVPAGSPEPSSGNSGGRRSKRRDKGELRRILTVIAVAAAGILIAGVVVYAIAVSPKSESEYVDTDRLQAVFLNTGQVYFGHIKSLNNDYFVVTGIYYLQATNNANSDNASSGTTNSNITLVKLGCELHEPYDRMVINSDQVTFWENLQDGGQVAKAVKTFQEQNPNGQKCADQSSSASPNSADNAQNAAPNNAGSNSSSNKEQ